jgi:ribosomal protein S18 acetylase RimI-like enzyme
VPGYVRLVRDLVRMPVGARHWPDWATLTPLTPALAPEAHALLVECYRTGYGSVPMDFDLWWAATRHDPEFDANLCFCVVQDEHLVGFELCWTSGFIKDLVVLPFLRHQGVGEALLRHAFATFKARGATEVALKVEADNLAAIRLYRKVGFADPAA